MNRWNAWWQQALLDLGHARHSLEAEDFEWAVPALNPCQYRGLLGEMPGHRPDAWSQCNGAIDSAREYACDLSSCEIQPLR